MIPGLNPRKMQQMMKQLGIQQVDIPATEVIIRTEDKEIIISNPSVAKVNMMGQETFQISGVIREEKISSAPEISEDDIGTVMEQAAPLVPDQRTPGRVLAIAKLKQRDRAARFPDEKIKIFVVEPAPAAVRIVGQPEDFLQHCLPARP